MSISQDKKAVVVDKQGLEYICSCIKLLQSVPELLNDLTPSQKTVYSSYKVTELINALGENLQTYVNTSLGALNNLKKEIVQTVPSVDTAEENTIYLLKNDGDGGYSQYLLINGVVENLGSTTAINNVYTKTETDAKFALLSTLNDLIATVGGLNELKTDTKESIVKAINELNDRNYLEVIEITAKSVLDYAKTFDILTHTYFYANNCVDLPNNEHYGYCSVEVSQDPFYRDITFYSPTDGRIYVNTIGANAEGSDFGTWSGWHKHLTNNDIVDTINSSSTDNQIPSALAVKTELDKKVDKSNILSTISASPTNEQVYGAFIMNTMLNNKDNIAKVIGGEINVDTTTANIKGWCVNLKGTTPNGSTAGWFSNEYVNNTTINQKFISYNKTMYIRSMFGGTWSKWAKVCTTSVADVAWTELTLDSGMSGNMSYRIKNGICYVNVNNLKSSTMSTIGQTIVIGLPIPETTKAWHQLISNTATNGGLLVNIDSTGKMIRHAGLNNEVYFGSFSYPVAEQ